MIGSTKKTLAMFAVLLVAITSFAAVITTDSSDAASFDQYNVKTSGFDQDKTGTFAVPVSNADADPISVMITVTNAYDSSKVYYTSLMSTVIPGNGTADVEAYFSLGAGENVLKITLTIVDGDDTFNGSKTTSFNYTIDVKASIWSQAIVYITIIFIIVVVIIGAIYYIRTKPRNKPTTSFTQLEAEKKAAESESAPGNDKKETGKIKYVSSRRK